MIDLSGFIVYVNYKKMDKYEAREALRKYLSDKLNKEIDFRVCEYKEYLNEVYERMSDDR